MVKRTALFSATVATKIMETVYLLCYCFNSTTALWLQRILFLFTCAKIEYVSVRTYLSTRGQSNLTKSASRGAHSPVRGHPRGSKVVPLNSWGRVSY